MKILNSVLCIVGLAGCVYAEPSGKATATDNVAEYCAEIVNDSTYSPRLIKDLNIPIEKWDYPDSIPCTHTPCRARWKFENDIRFPYDIHCRDDCLEGLLGGGGGFGIATCADCAKFPIKIERLYKITLFGTLIDDPNRSWKHKSKIYMRNARESLKALYGLAFPGEWTATLNTREDGDFAPIKHRFNAKLVGECSDTIPALDYCVNSKDGSLYLTNRYEVLPKLKFGKGKKRHEWNNEVLRCEGAMRVEKSFAVDFGKFGKKTLVHFTETDTCHVSSDVAVDVYMPIPEFIDAGRLAGIPVKNLLGKTFSIQIDNELTCNTDVIKKNTMFRGRISGKCSNMDVREKKILNLFEFEQVEELEEHHESIAQWVECGKGYVCPESCIEVKDLLQ